MFKTNTIFKLIIIFVFCVKSGMATLVGSCNQCFSSNKVACLDETHFATCFKGSPTSTVTKCPGNRFCTDDALICRSPAEGFTPVCYQSDYCGDCAATNGVFTCLDEIRYGYCFGGQTPTKDSIRPCPSGYVCNFSTREVCVSKDKNEPSCGVKTTTTTKEPTTTTMKPTTEISTISSESTTDDAATTHQTTTTYETTTEISTTTTQTIDTSPETTTSTTAKPRDANTICGEIGKTGYFKSDDPTCRKYVYCYLLSGQYLGWFYYCDGYFNNNTQKCQIERPPNCIAF